MRPDQPPGGPWAKCDRASIGAFVVLCIIVGGLYVSLRGGGAIWWSDASRNALNGAFVLDFLKAMPLRHPVDFAYDYYRQWPALTILFYPPLFYGFIAASYALFGVSEASAALVACLFLLALGWGAFTVSRRWLKPPAALAVAVLTIGSPEMSYWGQQVMLDVPACAFMVWAAAYHFKYLETRSLAAICLAVLFAVLSIYTKYNSAFIVIPMALSVLSAHGGKALTDRKIWRAMALGVVLMIPLVAIFFAFGRYNLEQAASVPTATTGRWSLAGWTYYASVLPASLSWPIAILATGYAVAIAAIRRFRIETPALVFFAAWLAAGYAFYSLVAVKEPRYDLFAVYPLALASVLFLDRALGPASLRLAAPLALSLAVLAFSQIEKPAPFVTGMREATDIVAKSAPRDSNVAFWGRWDGSFIFDMRAYADRPDLGVLRLDKLLISDVVVSFNLGMKDKDLTRDQILDAFRAYHVQYVVFQTGFRTDIASVATLQSLLESDRFDPVADIPMTSNYPFSFVTSLAVYRFREPAAPGRVLPPIEIKLLGRSIG